jgi:hypothetical protein
MERWSDDEAAHEAAWAKARIADLRSELADAVRLLRLAHDTISDFADQQAMSDDWFKPVQIEIGVWLHANG